jgi:hypothetical protein
LKAVASVSQLVEQPSWGGIERIGIAEPAQLLAYTALSWQYQRLAVM